MSDKEPYWCIFAVAFVLFDVWDYAIGYVEFKECVKNMTIRVPKTASDEEIKKILSEEIGKLIRGKGDE